MLQSEPVGGWPKICWLLRRNKSTSWLTWPVAFAVICCVALSRITSVKTWSLATGHVMKTEFNFRAAFDWTTGLGILLMMLFLLVRAFWRTATSAFSHTPLLAGLAPASCTFDWHGSGSLARAGSRFLLHALRSWRIFMCCPFLRPARNGWKSNTMLHSNMGVIAVPRLFHGNLDR